MSTTKPKKGGTLKKLLLSTVALAVIGGGGAGAGFYFANAGNVDAAAEEKPDWPLLVTREDAEHLGEDDAPRVGSVEVESDKVRPDPAKYAVAYIPIAENFTSNLAGGSGFIQVSINLATYYDDKVEQNVTRQMVPIRSAILMVLSEQNPDAASTIAGKKAMQTKLTGAINDVLRDKEGFGGIDNVYFSNFVLQ